MNRQRLFLIFTFLVQIVALVSGSVWSLPVFFEKIQLRNSSEDISVALQFNSSQSSPHYDQLAPPSIPAMHSPNNFEFDYDYPPVPQSANTVRIPILTYHQVAPLPAKGSARDYFVSPEMFEKQMAYLKEKQYKTLSMQEFYDQLKSGQNPTQKSVLITFDDGNSNNYSNAFPILKKYGFVATFFVVSGSSGISNTQLKEMVAAGMDIESHSQTHDDLEKQEDGGKLTSETSGSKAALTYMSGSDVISIAYPGCTADSKAIGYVKLAGYSLGFTCGKRIDHKYYGRYVIQRVHVYSNLENFKQRLSGICNYTQSFE